MSQQELRPPIGKKIKLADYDPNFHDGLDKDNTKVETVLLQKRLKQLQSMLFADKSQALLIVLQAMDAGGKDGTIKHVFTGVNPQGVRVAGFKQPSDEELAHDFLWRIHQHVPEKGYIGIFNRSHYEDVLIVRVNNLVPKAVWEKRYDHINHFEKLLVDSGTRILKFYLHIDRDEQKERFEERLQRPDKNWKFSRGDLGVRKQWDEYMKAYETAIYRCHTDDAPWHIVPANRKWYRNYVVMKTIIETLEDMNLKYPDPEPDLDKIVIDS